MKKKIIITGGLGYIGSELCKIYSGVSWMHKIVVLDNRFISERVNQLRNWNIEFIHGDILDKNLVEKNIVNNEIEYSAKSSIEKKIVPNFFIDKSIKVFDNETLLKGLKLVGDYLEKTVLKPNNLNSPINRNYFISTLK